MSYYSTNLQLAEPASWACLWKPPPSPSPRLGVPRALAVDLTPTRSGKSSPTISRGPGRGLARILTKSSHCISTGNPRWQLETPAEFDRWSSNGTVVNQLDAPSRGFALTPSVGTTLQTEGKLRSNPSRTLRLSESESFLPVCRARTGTAESYESESESRCTTNLSTTSSYHHWHHDTTTQY